MILWRINMKTLSRFFKAQDGATAIEYALIAALIAIVAIVGMTSLGTSISTQFSAVGSTLSSATK
jgi:pilus assembly protein Flp/PilA